jgi:ATP-dependent Lon protease
MTGEIMLSGRVLPVGGIREKVLAAYRAGSKRIVLPARNEQDLEEVPEDVRQRLEFVLVGSIDELWETVFGGKSKRARRAKAARQRTARGTTTTRSTRCQGRRKRIGTAAVKKKAPSRGGAASTRAAMAERPLSIN